MILRFLDWGIAGFVALLIADYLLLQVRQRLKS